MKLPLDSKGFTMIELLIVLAIMSFLLALSAPFITSTRADIAMNRTLRQVKTDLITNMGYALAGKSIGALSKGDITDASQIPSHYGLYFQAGEFGNQEPYRYLEMTTDGLSEDVKLNYDFVKEWPASAVALKDIRLISDSGASERSVSNLLIVFSAPFGKVNFMTGHDELLSGNSISVRDAMEENKDIKQIKLDFQYKNNEISTTTLSFNTDKTINIQ
jgi:prepilin-type N-terminal cleavage/methylation domain-containing protein